MAQIRKTKYTKKMLSEAVNAYFSSISYTVVAKDEDGCELRNDDGKEILVRKYATPPSISGLCLYLGIDRSTWQNYADARLHPEMKAVTEEARARIEVYLEEELLTRRKGVQGIIFNLQNNYGWKQKQEIELGAHTRRTMATEGMSIKEKLAFISAEQAARAAAFAGEDGEDGKEA